MNTNELRARVKKGMETNSKLREALMKSGISMETLDQMSDQELEARMSAKMMGMMGMKDFSSKSK